MSEKALKSAKQGAVALMMAITFCGSGGLMLPEVANAVLSAPNAKVARTSDAALRRSIPAYN